MASSSAGMALAEIQSVTDDVEHSHNGSKLVQSCETENFSVSILPKCRPEDDMTDDSNDNGCRLGDIVVIGDGENHRQRANDKERNDDDNEGGIHDRSSLISSTQAKGQLLP